MSMALHPFIQAALGGVILGIAVSMMLLLTGRLSGISGILGGVVKDASRDSWRIAFLAGLIAGGVAAGILLPGAFDAIAIRSLPILAVAGVVVGFGTRLANGCTSGHGLIGLGRFSKRSLAAVMTFMAVGVAAAVISARLFGGAT